jgi:predicted membrane-bound dolichyl-phosphate-mannose-protein mannosyltransferase
MKEELVEIHIKVPKSQYEYMQDFKEHFGVSMQDFYVTSAKEKIEQIQKENKK